MRKSNFLFLGLGITLISSCGHVAHTHYTEESVKVYREPIVVEAKPIVGKALSISKEELKTVEQVLRDIKLRKYSKAITELEDILNNNPSPGMKCTALALLSYTALQMGQKNDFLTFAEDMVEACKRFRFLPDGIRVLAKLYSNWTGTALPPSLEAEL